MIDLGLEIDDWWFERVLIWQLDMNLEVATLLAVSWIVKRAEACGKGLLHMVIVADHQSALPT